MSFPNIIYGKYGDEKETAASAIGGLPLGQKMILPDGREFAHAQVSATTGVAGRLYQANDYNACLATVKGLAVVADTSIGASNTIGATTLVLGPISGTILAASAFNGGVIFFSNSAGPGGGNTYKILTSGSASSTATFTVVLERTDGLVEAITAASTKCGLRQNPFKNITVVTADTVNVGPIAGVLPVDVLASRYCWVQRKGPAACNTDNTTLVIGNPVTASTTVDGQVAVQVITGTGQATVGVGKAVKQIGTCLSVAASAEYSLVDLQL